MFCVFHHNKNKNACLSSKITHKNKELLLPKSEWGGKDRAMMGWGT
jgi:hypothetical protein